jgi:glycosyltransferase involved in cell wall biosynthesis
VTRLLHAAQPVDGGVGHYVADLARAQAATGLDVAVASPPGLLADEVHAAGVRWVQWDAVRSPGPSVVGETRRLASVVRDARPDVVHLHSSKAGLAGRLLLRGRVPTVFQPHGWSWQAGGGAIGAASARWERLAARWTALLVCVSEAERLAGEQRRVCRPGLRTDVVPNGVDLSRFHPVLAAERDRLRASAGLPVAAPVAVCVGRLDRQKGQDVLVRSWLEVRATCPAALLVLVGSGPRRSPLESLAAELGLGDSVRFVGEQPDPQRWYALADVVAFVSQWGEAMALTPLEGMACGRPVVATDVAGVRESVASGCGAVVPVADSGALAAALVARLSSPDLVATEGAAARSHVQRRHDVADTHRRVTEAALALA